MDAQALRSKVAIDLEQDYRTFLQREGRQIGPAETGAAMFEIPVTTPSFHSTIKVEVLAENKFKVTLNGVARTTDRIGAIDTMLMAAGFEV